MTSTAKTVSYFELQSRSSIAAQFRFDVKLVGMRFYNETLTKTYFEEDLTKLL